MTRSRAADITRTVELDAPVRRVLQLWVVYSRQQQLEAVERILILRDTDAAEASPSGSSPSVPAEGPTGTDEDDDPRMIHPGGPALGRLIEAGSVEFIDLPGDRTRLTIRLQLTPSVETPSAVTTRLAELRVKHLLRRLADATGTTDPQVRHRPTTP